MLSSIAKPMTECSCWTKLYATELLHIRVNFACCLVIIYKCLINSNLNDKVIKLLHVCSPWMLKKSPQVYSCFSISSSSERTMDLVLEMCNTNSIHWCGVSGRQLGKLHPSSSLHLALTLLSSVQGLQVSLYSILLL